MIDGLEKWQGGKADTLAVVLHGWLGSRDTMSGVTEATKDALGSNGGVDVYVPQLPYRSYFSVARATAMVITLLGDVDRIIEERGRYNRIIMIGHSMGGVLGRRLFLLAAGIPPGFQFRCEKAFAGEEAAARPWATLIDRHVTLGAFNRGWKASERDSWRYSFVFNLMGLWGHMVPNSKLSSTIFDLRVGSPFMVQTRLHWLAFRRWQEQLRSASNSDQQADPLSSPPGDPLVVQVIGNADDVTSPLNQADIAIDRPDNFGGRCIFLEMQSSSHDQTIEFTDDPLGRYRRELFMAALTEPPAQLINSRASDPTHLVDDPPQIDPTVTDGIFVIHGIRDDGYWTNRIAKRLKERAPRACVLKTRTPTYGYFAMLPFVLPWIRRQKVEWFMDQYVGARAQFPNAEISFIGHSNGTYLAARALKDYDDASFKNIFFAGSVVQRNYPWRAFVEAGRVKQFHNVRAARDWVVALLPKSVEHLSFFDMGGAGFDGFDEAGTHPRITQAEHFANGNHSGAMVETQWDHIADFIVAGKVPEEIPIKDFVPERPCWLRGLAATHLFLPLIIILVFGIPLWLAWPLLPALTAHGLAWPQPELTVTQAIGHSLGLAVTIALLKFVITRV
jgi:pimeloyl-ACP methyl ester carboxylesterase